MKEITIKLTAGVAESIIKEAEELGISAEELLRYIVGDHCRLAGGLRLPDFSKMLDDMDSNFSKKILKMQSKSGSLSCKNCTQRLSEEDVEKGRCSACDAPIQ